MDSWSKPGWDLCCADVNRLSLGSLSTQPIKTRVRLGPKSLGFLPSDSVETYTHTHTHTKETNGTSSWVELIVAIVDTTTLTHHCPFLFAGLD